ncbi:hypothetical protein M409DRAFT_16936 [Zasmidium cellare ATCC 36951]|uniref:Uncharacterized protein n=1 Tax=Zasmidium cellare ATCC 36951 TaxID=1080233 RepID=A0A6A6D1D4_ZASCE|nr:uncharacterized protein M409DRAFT_16936 [Zasmidium cellare ATCC 36951]KAF2172985.1 hypothetical protein M409DRAFT_16936 [Zasmidium cellare ATCC 36951]
MTDVTPTFRRTTYPTISPSNPSNDQSNRTVLVIGGSEGIGFSIALAYAQANASKIILSSRSQAKLDDAVAKIRARGVKRAVTSIPLDSSDVAQIGKFWTRLREEEGVFVDVLVLNAAKVGATTTAAEVVEFFQFNVASKLYMLENFQKQAGAGEEKRHKVLIDITSAAAHAYPYAMNAYGSSKAAFSNYLCHLADEVPEGEMRLVTMHPGAVYTAAASGSAEYSSDLPIWDHPSLAGHMALWLSTPAAAFLHGRFVWANWDAEGLVEMKQKILDDAGFLKIGVTGVNSFSVGGLMAKCTEVPAPQDRSLT